MPYKEPVTPPRAYIDSETVKLPVTNAMLLVTVLTYKFVTSILDAVTSFTLILIPDNKLSAFVE